MNDKLTLVDRLEAIKERDYAQRSVNYNRRKELLSESLGQLLTLYRRTCNNGDNRKTNVVFLNALKDYCTANHLNMGTVETYLWSLESTLWSENED